jgi:hypothetical protein
MQAGEDRPQERWTRESEEGWENERRSFGEGAGAVWGRDALGQEVEIYIEQAAWGWEGGFKEEQE